MPAYEALGQRAGRAAGTRAGAGGYPAFIRDHRIRNVVWVTADVHYAAAHRYDPAVAEFKSFLPFWEFVAGPLHAGTFGPRQARPDVWLHAGLQQRARRTSSPTGRPSEGLQFFGTLTIDPATRRLTVALWNLDNDKLWSVPSLDAGMIQMSSCR